MYDMTRANAGMDTLILRTVKKHVGAKETVTENTLRTEEYQSE